VNDSSTELVMLSRNDVHSSSVSILVSETGLKMPTICVFFRKLLADE